MSRDVAILGCGPAGLLTAWAVEQAGFCPVIFSIPEKSKMPGAQFLHKPIPGLTDPAPDLRINFVKLGSREGYAQKVYGRRDAPTSWDAFPEGPRAAWALAPVYDRLWDRYRGEVVEGEILARTLDGIESRFQRAFSTIPVQVLCEHSLAHQFRWADVWIRSAPARRMGHDFIEYNGNPGIGHYRASRINGELSQEFGHRVGGAHPGRKPLDTNCDCRPFFHRLGRFGKWSKGVLVHHAYEEARDALQ